MMTKEEAIECLISVIYETKTEAINMAIKALEQEPCEDVISRKAVLDKIKEVCFSNEQKWVDFRISQGSNGQRDFIIKFIESLPSVTPKQTDILDKIRSEIADIYCGQYCENPLTADAVREMALEIIDKYKAESEEKK